MGGNESGTTVDEFPGGEAGAQGIPVQGSLFPLESTSPIVF